MEKHFKTDRRTKKEIIKIYGEARYLPFGDLENYTDEEDIENLGSAYYNDIVINGNLTNDTVYRFKGKLYIVESMEHFNTQLISAKLMQLIEK